MGQNARDLIDNARLEENELQNQADKAEQVAKQNAQAENERLKEQANNGENEQQKQADKEEQQRRLAEQQAEEERKVAETPNTTAEDEKSWLDKAKEVGKDIAVGAGEVAGEIAMGVLGIQKAHAADMPQYHTQPENTTPQEQVKLEPQTSRFPWTDHEELQKLQEQGLVDKPNVGQAEKQQADKQPQETAIPAENQVSGSLNGEKHSEVADKDAHKEPQNEQEKPAKPHKTRQPEHLSLKNNHQNQGNYKKTQPTTAKSDTINGVSGGVKDDFSSPNQQNAHKTGDKPDRIVADLDSKAQSIGHSPKLNNHYKNPEVKLSTWDKIGSNLPSLPDNMVNFVAGMGDFISFGATEWVRDKADIDGGVNANSKSYKAGEVAGLTVGLVSGGSLATVGAKTISGKVARVTTATIAADVAGRAATGSFSIQYDEQQCNALNKMSSRKSPWIDGSKPLRTSDLTDEHNFLQEVGVAKKLPNGGYSYEVNGVDMAYVLTENRFARSAGKTGLSLGKVTQIPATVMGVVGSDVYSLYTSIGNPKGTRINEIKTDLKGTYMGAVLSLSKDMQTGVDAKCNKPNKKR